MTRLRILPEVADDIALAARWYQQRRFALGAEFVDAVYALFKELASAPLARKTIYKEVRRGFMRRFPYAVYYSFHENEVVILLVFHFARNPGTVSQILRRRKKSN